MYTKYKCTIKVTKQVIRMNRVKKCKETKDADPRNEGTTPMQRGVAWLKKGVTYKRVMASHLEKFQGTLYKISLKAIF